MAGMLIGTSAPTGNRVAGLGVYVVLPMWGGCGNAGALNKEPMMNSMTRRGSTAAMVAALALTATGVLTACSSEGSSDPSPSSSSSTQQEPTSGAQMIGPVMVEPGQTEVSATVGRTIVFNVADPEKELISTNNPEVLAVSPGGSDGSAVFNPGAEALAPGTATVTLTNTETGATQVVSVTITN